MIEIIREESWDSTQEKTGLPKNIKQIGTPDIGERIYIENSVYQYIHPFHSRAEKSAYVLLGRFEEYGGRKCTFIEAAILLEEICFDGMLPMWNDDTWAYLYRKLKHSYDEMVIVGWAMDIQGQLPNLTAPLEKLHRTYFGGVRQLLFLMDSLDGEENFYTQKNGRLSRREGYYIYYDRTIPARLDSAMDMLRQEKPDRQEKENWQESGTAAFAMEEQEDSTECVKEWKETGIDEEADGAYLTEGLRMRGSKYRPDNADYIREKRNQTEARSALYRDYIREQAEKKMTRPAYSSTLLLAVVAIALGFAALHNYDKMNEMEQALAQMNVSQTMVGTESRDNVGGTEVSQGTFGLAEGSQGAVIAEADAAGTVAENGMSKSAAETDSSGIKVETVSGNVSREEETTLGTENGQSERTEQSDESDNQSQESGGQDMGSGDSTSDSGKDGNSETASGTTANNDSDQKEEMDADENQQTTETMSESQIYLEQGYYIVQEGESLVAICKKIYQTTAMMDKLCEVNDIEDPDAIYAGQELILPN